MSKAKLEFDMSDIDDRIEHFRCIKSSDMASVLWEFSNNSRKRIEREFEDNMENNDVFDGIERCFEHFYDLLKDSNINIDEIYS
jgi:hypothetical protein